MAELSLVRDFIAIFGVIAGFSYYVLTVRATRKNQEQQLETRQAQLLIQIVNHWSQPSMVDALEVLRNAEFESVADALKQAEENPELSRAVLKAFGIYMIWVEGIGVLVKEGYLDIKIIAELMSVSVKIYWEKYEPIIMYLRETLNSPRQYIDFEYLYNAIMKYYEEHPELPAP